MAIDAWHLMLRFRVSFLIGLLAALVLGLVGFTTNPPWLHSSFEIPLVLGCSALVPFLIGLKPLQWEAPEEYGNAEKRIESGIYGWICGAILLFFSLMGAASIG